MLTGRLLHSWPATFDRAQKLMGRRGYERHNENRKVLQSLPAAYSTDEVDAILASASLTSAADRFLSLPRSLSYMPRIARRYMVEFVNV